MSRPKSNNKPRVSAVEDRIYGIWLWENPETGAYLSDGEGRFLNVFTTKYDLAAIAKLREAATAMGYGEGRPVFKAGERPLTDAEHDLMMERLIDGLEPDPAEEYLQSIEKIKEENQ